MVNINNCEIVAEPGWPNTGVDLTAPESGTTLTVYISNTIISGFWAGVEYTNGFEGIGTTTVSADCNGIYGGDVGRVIEHTPSGPAAEHCE